MAESTYNKESIIANVIPDIIFINDTRGYYYKVIRGRYSTNMHHHQDVVGRNIRDYLSREDAENLLHIFNDVAKNNILGEFEYKLHIDGCYAYFEARILKINPKKVVSFVRDITANKQKQKQILLQNMKLKVLNEELDSLVYKASHDLRAPLASMMGLLYLLKDEKREDIRGEYMAALEKSAKRMDCFIHEIINLSRGKHNKLDIEKIDFHSLLGNILGDLEYIEKKEYIKKNISIAVAGEFYTDVKKLQIILTNLIGNAIKYSKPVRNNPYLKVRIVGKPNDRFVSILISDNGIGIEERHLGRIFEMFYRANDIEVGSGLGLYIVKEAVKKLRGKIMVESTQFVGTKFKIILPSLEQGRNISEPAVQKSEGGN